MGKRKKQGARLNLSQKKNKLDPRLVLRYLRLSEHPKSLVELQESFAVAPRQVEYAIIILLALGKIDYKLKPVGLTARKRMYFACESDDWKPKEY